MKVFLLRHTEAAPGNPDRDRPLTPSGRQTALKLAEFVKDKPYFTFHKIWSSPYLRARQTAEPFLDSILPGQTMRFSDDLLPDANPVQIFNAIKCEEEPLLIVGHNPHLTRLSALLCEANSSLPGFKKGALVVFKQDASANSGFRLSAFLPPSALGLEI